MKGPSRIGKLACAVWFTVVTGAMAVPGIYTNVVLNDTPVGYWRLGETSGTTAFDETAFNNDGAYTTNMPDGYPPGVVTLGVPGVVTYDPNTAIHVTNGGRVVVPHSASLNLSTGMTVEAWASLDAPTGINYYQPLVMKSLHGWSSGYGIYANQGEIFAYIDTYNPLSLKTVSVPISFSTNTHHFVSTFENSILSLYIDGTLVASTNVGVASISPNTEALSIGAASGTPGLHYLAYWVGKIDEVAVYDYALTAGQVYDHFHSVPEPTAAVLIGACGLLLRRRKQRTG